MKLNYFLLYILVLFSCTAKKNQDENLIILENNSFPNTYNLISNVWNYSPVNDPMMIKVLDSCLYICNSNSDYFLDIYNLTDGSLIDRAIRKGKGPNELIYLKWIQKKDILNKVYVQCSQTKKIIEISKNADSFYLKDISIVDKGALNLQIIDTSFVGFNFEPELVSRLYYYNSSGIVYDTKGEYSTLIPKIGQGLDAHIAEAEFTVGPDNKKIAIAYVNTDLFEIYNINGLLEKRIYGPDFFKPEFTTYDMNGFSGVKWDKKQKTAYMEITSSDKFIYLLYAGKYNTNEEYMYCNELFKFDWNGNPVAKYTLDRSIFNFDIDKSEEFLYGLSYENQEIYKFCLK